MAHSPSMRAKYARKMRLRAEGKSARARPEWIANPDDYDQEYFNPKEFAVTARRAKIPIFEKREEFASQQREAKERKQNELVHFAHPGRPKETLGQFTMEEMVAKNRLIAKYRRIGDKIKAAGTKDPTMRIILAICMWLVDWVKQWSPKFMKETKGRISDTVIVGFYDKAFTALGKVLVNRVVTMVMNQRPYVDVHQYLFENSYVKETDVSKLLMFLLIRYINDHTHNVSVNALRAANLRARGFDMLAYLEQQHRIKRAEQLGHRLLKLVADEEIVRKKITFKFLEMRTTFFEGALRSSLRGMPIFRDMKRAISEQILLSKGGCVEANPGPIFDYFINFLRPYFFFLSFFLPTGLELFPDQDVRLFVDPWDGVPWENEDIYTKGLETYAWTDKTGGNYIHPEVYKAGLFGFKKGIEKCLPAGKFVAVSLQPAERDGYNFESDVNDDNTLTYKVKKGKRPQGMGTLRNQIIGPAKIGYVYLYLGEVCKCGLVRIQNTKRFECSLEAIRQICTSRPISRLDGESLVFAYDSNSSLSWGKLGMSDAILASTRECAAQITHVKAHFLPKSGSLWFLNGDSPFTVTLPKRKDSVLMNQKMGLSSRSSPGLRAENLSPSRAVTYVSGKTTDFCTRIIEQIGWPSITLSPEYSTVSDVRCPLLKLTSYESSPPFVVATSSTGVETCIGYQERSGLPEHHIPEPERSNSSMPTNIDLSSTEEIEQHVTVLSKTSHMMSLKLPALSCPIQTTSNIVSDLLLSRWSIIFLISLVLLKVAPMKNVTSLFVVCLVVAKSGRLTLALMSAIILGPMLYFSLSSLIIYVCYSAMINSANLAIWYLGVILSISKLLVLPLKLGLGL
uniref:Uncharacterized protein n=1 Tax=Leptomonas pyrrhocoris tombus-like virus TaxID=3070845 RepID=A0AA50KIE2_9TOMB|nr:hypothetical protein [Leptomonas pyrrhocoris tombus-like virus]